MQEQRSGESLSTVSSINQVRFDEKGLVPAVVQEAGTRDVLMVAYMNREALERTLASGVTWFYSRSRQRLWQKGESSGNVQRVLAVKADCDFDTLLVEVEQAGAGACHTGDWTCFHNPVAVAREERPAAAAAAEPGLVRTAGGQVPSAGSSGDGVSNGSSGENEAALPPAGFRSSEIVHELYEVIVGRKIRPVQGSYTSYLFEKGLDKILKKIGEETAEVVIAAKNGDRGQFVAESADLVYHLLVAMAELGVDPGALWAELAKRRGGGGSEDKPPGK